MQLKRILHFLTEVGNEYHLAVPIPLYVYFDITLPYEFESVAPDESMTSCPAMYISITFKQKSLNEYHMYLYLTTNQSNMNRCGL